MPMIPFNRPYVGRRAAEMFERVAASTHHSGDGPVTLECAQLLSELVGGATVVLTPSCTHALELAALVLDVGPDDEVIVPAFTFPSTATAWAMRGARVRFADVDSETHNLSPASVGALLTDRTRVIVPMHYSGIGCDMAALTNAVRDRPVLIVEDNAHGLFGALAGRPLGTFGSLGTLSFHETKNLSCGEGGALVINDKSLIEAVHVAREKGTNRHAFIQRVIDRYHWVGLGSSWLPSEFASAVLLAALHDVEHTQSHRMWIWNRYRAELDRWAAANDVELPVVPAESQHPAHLFTLVLPHPATRERFIEHMADHGVQVVFHYLPLNRAPAAKQFGTGVDDCPIAESLAERLVRLPLYANLTRTETDLVIEAATRFAP